MASLSVPIRLLVPAILAILPAACSAWQIPGFPPSGQTSQLQPEQLAAERQGPAGAENEEGGAGNLPPNVAVISAGSGDGETPVARIESRLLPGDHPESMQLWIEFRLADACHVYPLDDDPARNTRFELSSTPYLQIAGPARPLHPPVEVPDPLEGRIRVHSGTSVFIVPLTVISQPPDRDWNLRIRINGLICSDAGFCLPVRNKILKAVEGPPSPPAGGRSASLILEPQSGSAPGIR